MATSTLVNHKGARLVSFEELVQTPTPPATTTWFPVPHHQVFQSVSDTLEGAGFGIRQTRLSLTREGARFFGTLDLTTPVTDGVALAVADVSPPTDSDASERESELSVPLATVE